MTVKLLAGSYRQDHITSIFFGVEYKMKKAIAAAASILVIAAVITGCNARDGRVDDNSYAENRSRVNETTGYGRMNDTDRRIIEGNDSASAIDRNVVVENNNTYNDNNSRYRNNDNGVVGDVGDMVGNGINDVTNGIENVGDTVASGVEDITNGNDDTDNIEQ